VRGSTATIRLPDPDAATGTAREIFDAVLRREPVVDRFDSLNVLTDGTQPESDIRRPT
jgi:hypothetical protein